MCLGIPGQLVEIVDLVEHRAIADVDGVRREVNIHLVEGEAGGIKVGDWVLIHVGFAMSRIDEEEAERTLSFIKALGDVYEDELAQFGGTGKYAENGAAGDDMEEAGTIHPAGRPVPSPAETLS